MDKHEWILAAGRDGVPCLWISETVGLTSDRVRRFLAENGIRPEREWVSTQLGIRKHPILAPLHAEFTPKKRR